MFSAIGKILKTSLPAMLLGGALVFSTPSNAFASQSNVSSPPPQTSTAVQPENNDQNVFVDVLEFLGIDNLLGDDDDVMVGGRSGSRGGFGGSRGGGSRGGWGGSRSNNRGSANRNSGSRADSASKNRSGNYSNKSSRNRAQTQADRKLHDRAKRQGTHYKTRSEAVNAFKKNKGDQLRSQNPVRFDQKPETRPSYIPQTHRTADGQTVNINYNSNYGGYGFMNALGVFVMYDIMTNQAFVNSQMRAAGYAYGPPPSSGANAAAIIGIIMAIIVIGIIIFIILDPK